MRFTIAGLICALTFGVLGFHQAEAHHGYYHHGYYYGHHHSFGHSFARGLGYGVGSGLGYGVVNRVFEGGPWGYGSGGYYSGGYAVPYTAPSYAPPSPSTNVVVIQQPALAGPPGYPYPVPGYTHFQPGQGYVAQTITYVQGYGYVPTPQPITP